MQTTGSIRAIKHTCSLLSQGKMEEAALEIKSHYPFKPVTKSPRKYTPFQMASLFVRDGFVDRYKGDLLVFPPALRLISYHLPREFPYHPNGKMDAGHIAYWELFPTIDHVIPVSRGGKDEEANWVCCSMLTNSVKSNWTLKEIGWELLPPGDIKVWDGMFNWFVEQIDDNKKLLSDKYFRIWYNAAKHCAA